MANPEHDRPRGEQWPPHGQQQYGGQPPGWTPPGASGPPPGGPPPRSKLPWIISGVLAAVVVVLVGCVIILLDRSDETERPHRAPADTTSSTAAADAITYEITGTISGPLAVTYTGTDGKVDVTVEELPWSVSVSPAPSHVSIFAINTDVFADDPDITLTIKRGEDILRECEDGGVCIATASG